MKNNQILKLTAAIKLLNEHSEEDFVSKAQAKLAADNLQSIIDEDNSTLLSPLRGIVDEILTELEHAESKHPDWPCDKVYAAAIVSEESGELMRAAVQTEMEDGDIELMRKEAVQTAATCIRLIFNLYQ